MSEPVLWAAEELSLAIGRQTLYDNAEFFINAGERVGLIGRNGSGKSTLLRLITGEELPGSGNLTRARNLRVAVLPQDFEIDNGRSIADNVRDGLAWFLELQKKFETVKDTLRKQISSVLYRTTSFEDFSDRLLQQYGIAVKESRGCLSYLPAGRTKFIRAKHLGDKFDKAAVLATLQANAERKPKAQFKQDTIGKLIDIQSRMTEGKGIGYKRWLTKHNLKVMAQTVKLLQEKGLTDEDALNQRIAELETKYHDTLAVVKDLETRMAENKNLRSHATAYQQYRPIAQKLKAAKRPAAFEEQHRAELTAYRAAAAYFKANNITKLPSPKKLEAEYAQLASEKAKFYEQYKEAKEELLKLKTAKQNVASFFREEEPAQQER